MLVEVGSGSSDYPCCNDEFSCDRVIHDDLSGHVFGACYVKNMDGTLVSVCPRFALKSDVVYREDRVRKERIPK